MAFFTRVFFIAMMRRCRCLRVYLVGTCELALLLLLLLYYYYEVVFHTRKNAFLYVLLIVSINVRFDA